MMTKLDPGTDFPPFCTGDSGTILLMDADKLLEHVCDHMLSRPESNRWALLVPQLVPMLRWSLQDRENFVAINVRVDPHSGDREVAPAFRAIVCHYVNSSRTAVDDVVRESLMWDYADFSANCKGGVSLDGIFLSWNAETGCLRTAYIPVPDFSGKRGSRWKQRFCGCFCPRDRDIVRREDEQLLRIANPTARYFNYLGTRLFVRRNWTVRYLGRRIGASGTVANVLTAMPHHVQHDFDRLSWDGAVARRPPNP